MGKDAEQSPEPKVNTRARDQKNYRERKKQERVAIMAQYDLLRKELEEAEKAHTRLTDKLTALKGLTQEAILSPQQLKMLAAAEVS